MKRVPLDLHDESRTATDAFSSTKGGTRLDVVTMRRCETLLKAAAAAVAAVPLPRSANDNAHRRGDERRRM